MIGRLSGRLLHKQPPRLMIDVGGVGYELEAPMSTFYQLPASGEPVILHTHLLVRDDAHILYGFHDEAERALFRALLKVNGVGAKMALAILSGMSADEFSLCIGNADSQTLTRLPGIGKKTAERLIVEMRDRLDTLSGASAPAALPAGGAALAVDDPVADAVSALIALGYKAPEASRMVRKVAADGLDSEALIREALRAVTRK